MICLLLWACIQIGAGYTSFEVQGSGNYWEEPFPHSLQSQSPSGLVGLQGRNWRAGYEFLGGTSSRATVVDDASWSGGGGNGCKPGSLCNKGPMSTTGNTQGFYATYAPRWGHWGFEVGPWAYRSHVSMYQPDGPGKGPGFSNDSYHVGPMAGVNYTVGRLTFAITDRIATGSSQYPTLQRGGAINFSIRFSF